jgi:hypothetical protein
VHHVMLAFQKENPGTVYEIVRDANNVFMHLVFIPGQSYNIVKHSGRPYFSKDAGFSKKKGWHGQLFAFECSDGNNSSIPIAIGIYATESGDNYIHFMEAVKRVHDGAMGALLNHTAAVVCTDRHTSFAPALRASFPLAHHRHDLRHIMQNMNALGYISRYMWEAQKATTYGECLLCMKSWIAEQPQIEEYLHPSNLHPRMWTYYTAVLDPNPH